MRRSDHTPHTLHAVLTGIGLARTAGLIRRVTRPRRARPDRHDSVTFDLAAVATIDDPDGSLRIIAVSGIVESRTIGAVADAIFDEPVTGVHLDLADAVAWMPGVIDELEHVLDEAELLGVRLRVIGLDPYTLTLRDQASA